MRATEVLSHMLSRARPALTWIGDVQGAMNRNSAALLSSLFIHSWHAQPLAAQARRTLRGSPISLNKALRANVKASVQHRLPSKKSSRGRNS